MKTLRFLFPVVMACLCPIKASAGIDPVTAATVATQTLVLQNTYNDRAKQQKQLAAVETAVAGGLAAVHNVEKQMLDYLSNISGALQNLYQIKRAGELMIEIPQNASNLADVVKGHPMEAVLGTLVSRELTRISSEAASLYPFMQQLVTSGSYNIGAEKHKVNLLNSAERYYIADMIVSKLLHINRSLIMLRYQIEYFSWNNFFRTLDPNGWAMMWGGKSSMESVIRNWKNFKLKR